MSVSINGTTGLSLGAGSITFADSTTQSTAASGFGFKNRIINGAMMIDQRNAGAAVTTDGSFPVDRFKLGQNTDGACSVQQSTTAPDGFISSLKYTTTTADSSLTTTQNLTISQNIEGLNCSDLGWGTANAATVTLSFWVRSSLTGTFGGAICNSAINRSYPFSYTISSADTWEQKSVTITGDTTGTWLTTNGIGARIIFSMGSGPSVSGTAGSWAAAGYYSATGATSVIGTLSATWYITGVQLEKGSTATSFDYRPYGTELALCQRYFFKTFDSGTAPTNTNLTYPFCSIFATVGTSSYTGANIFPVKMRTIPSITFYNTAGGTSGTWQVYASGGSASSKTVSINSYLENAIVFYTSGAGYTFSYGDFTASAEL